MKFPIRIALKASALMTLLAAAGCAELNDPYYSGSRYPNSGYGGYNDPYDDGRWQYEQGRRDAEREARRDREEHRQERRDRERENERDRQRERDREEQQRRRVEEERARQEAQRQYEQRQQDHCPAGFHETNRKCSDNERRHGCKDIKTPSGLRCINR